MEDKLLFLINELRYPAESQMLKELSAIMEQLGFETEILREDSDVYKDELEKYILSMTTEIDCKAVITCNAAEIERMVKMQDCLYVTYLSGQDISKYDNKLKCGSQNTIVLCSVQNQMEYIKDTYQNIGEVLYVNLNSESGNRLETEAALAMDIQDLIADKRGQSSVLKLLIQRALRAGELVRAENLIGQYKKLCPADLEVVSMETKLNLYSGNLEAALYRAMEGVRRYPSNADMHYNLGNAYEQAEEWFLAWMSYGRAFALCKYCKKDKKAEKLGLKNKIYFCSDKHDQNPDNRQHADYKYWLDRSFGLMEIAFRNTKQILGKYYWVSPYEKKYAGIYWEQLLTRHYDDNLDVTHTKGEFVQVTEGNEFYIKNEKAEVLLPIATEADNTVHRILHSGEEYQVRQAINRHFNYFRIPSDSRILSSGKSFYGRPIPLYQETGKKKLILNLFVDGLAQCILEGGAFQKLMPHTAAFFGKGTVCTRAYSAAEWTYPSIASYMTGLNTVHHMLFHNELDLPLPNDYPILNEYFHDDGYFTSELTGNWRAIPIYGYCRGCDQYVYQHGVAGFRAQELAGEIIDHIEAFKETNQVLGVCFGDLHDIADGFELPDAVQSHLNIKDCIDERIGVTSVKQEYSEYKRIKYEKMAARLDVFLNTVYQYIESNYKNADILISLYADHGQGYLVPPDAPFCSDGRARVAFMFRGDGVKSQICDEVISTCDYIKIMCRLAGIQMKDIEIDGVLPKAFGGEGREYAITESLHPGDHYNAAIYAEDCIFYFENSFPVQNDGRFYLRDCQIILTDLEGNRIDDNERYQKYFSIILEHIAPLCIYN